MVFLLWSSTGAQVLKRTLTSLWSERPKGGRVCTAFLSLTALIAPSELLGKTIGNLPSTVVRVVKRLSSRAVSSVLLLKNGWYMMVGIRHSIRLLGLIYALKASNAGSWKCSNRLRLINFSMHSPMPKWISAARCLEISFYPAMWRRLAQFVSLGHLSVKNT